MEKNDAEFVRKVEAFITEWNNADDRVLVHTSGSTGQPKPMWASKRLMANSARMTCDFLHLQPGDTALLCLPVDYIAGKMVVVRAMVRQLQLVIKAPQAHPLAGLHHAPTFAAMVPMQVTSGLNNAHERQLLADIRQLIIGGGAIDETLEKELRDFPNNVWSTYGMTETLSHIALRKINGKDADQWYTPFDHVNIATDHRGCLTIHAPLVCDNSLTTNDMVEIHPDGRRFRIIGRVDNVINSGGVKIHIEQVEERLRNAVDVPFAITKRRDPLLGEMVVMLVQSTELDALRQCCEQCLPAYWRPRLFISVDKIPTTDTGKPARKRAEQIAAQYMPK
ncbi:MAG: AMP-binding protein [Bacteroidales bacterium]|nr:AMP-binding protein [Bacteroidales bacterium]